MLANTLAREGVEIEEDYEKIDSLGERVYELLDRLGYAEADRRLLSGYLAGVLPLVRAKEPLLAHPLAPKAHYAQGKLAYTGLNTSARRPLASGRKVIPVSSFTIRRRGRIFDLELSTMKVRNDCIPNLGNPT